MTTQPIPIDPAERAEISVFDGRLMIRDFVERDPDVVELVAEAEDPVEATHQILRIGARAVRVAHVSLDGDLVERQFDAMTQRLTTQVEAAVGQITGAAEGLLDEEDGALTGILDVHTKEIESLLGATFDPDSKKSVLSLFESMLHEAHRQHTEAVRNLVSADGDDSPLAKVKREIVGDIKVQIGELKQDVKDVSEKISVHDAVAPVLDLTTGKGFRFEDVLDACVSRIAATHGDVAEHTGTTPGVAGTLKGDEVIVVNRDDTHGAEACFAFEAKAKKLNMRATLAELDAAIENRGALAAIAVFSTQDQAPTSVPFHYSENKAIAVLDKDGLDDSALRLAYMWARWVVRRQLAGAAADELDLARATRLLDDARRAIERHKTIKSCHTKARRAIDEAAGQVADMTAEVEDALDRLADEFSRMEGD